MGQNLPGQPSSVDFGAMVQNMRRSDQIIGGSLILLLIFSVIGAWFHYSFDSASVGIPGFSASASYNSLWNGLGIVAGLLIIVAIAYLVVRLFLSSQVTLPALPLSDGQLWMAFGAVEIVLFLLYFLTGKQDVGVGVGASGVSQFPGWAWFVGLVLAAGIIYGGFLKQSEPAAGSGSGGTPGGGYGAYGGGQNPGYGQPQYGAPEQPGYPPQQPPQQ